MTIWEITNRWLNDVASYTPLNDGMLDPWLQFGDGGTFLHWSKRPRLTLCEEEDSKPRPLGDVTSMMAPGPVLNAKAYTALSDFLGKFGQLLEVDIDGRTEYYYNVTNVISALNRERSEFEISYVPKPVFRKSLIPDTPCVFVDPELPVRIFVNDPAKIELESRIAQHKLIGMSFVQRHCED
jgi:hypothetical protein